MDFFVGLHHPAKAGEFARSCISINSVRGRWKPLKHGRVIIDSGAFTEIATHGGYRHPPKTYANELWRLYAFDVVDIGVAVAQDYMCEPFMLAKTGLTIAEHQRLTIERYDALAAEGLPFPIMPVLQGFAPSDYAAHVLAYGDRLEPGMWVGVGSVCKRNGRPESVYDVLAAVKALRPDLRLHGFGIKLTALKHPGVRELLATADSMAWSYSARKQGRDGNDVREAHAYVAKVEAACVVTPHVAPHKPDLKPEVLPVTL